MSFICLYYFYLPYSLFSSCLAFTPEVNPLSYSQIVTVQRDDVDVDESQSISISIFKKQFDWLTHQRVAMHLNAPK